MNQEYTPGFLLINKPIDWTSHDVIGYLRHTLQIKKIGHAGTLDPFATGLLVVAIGRTATKRIDEFKAQKKEYIAELTFGATSNTQDLTGTIKPYTQAKLEELSKEHIEHVLHQFLGEIEQIPPMFSAKKVKGQKLYELARKGIEIERAANNITIHELELLNFSQKQHTAKIRVVCSTGTYIRTLCHDIGQVLDTGAYCSTLDRTRIGPYYVENAVAPKEVTQKNYESLILEA